MVRYDDTSTSESLVEVSTDLGWPSEGKGKAKVEARVKADARVLDEATSKVAKAKARDANDSEESKASPNDSASLC